MTSTRLSNLQADSADLVVSLNTDRGAYFAMNSATHAAHYDQINRKAVADADILPLYQAATICGAVDGLEWQPTSNESLFLNRMSWTGE